SGICKVAIVGYTNAGKSTLLNRLTDAGILAEDKLFATLDPTTRKFTLPDGTEVLLVDTVGFIRNLPHHLIKAFRSTLDEAVYADIILTMTDASDKECEAQLGVTEKLLCELGAADKPTLCVFNKCDKEGEQLPTAPASVPRENVFYVSAKTGQNVEALVNRLGELVNESTSRVTFAVPMARQDVVAGLYRFARVEEVAYEGDTTLVTAVCDARAKGMFREWIKV
ncbi:MAG: GTP-binding protein, partial [Ruminococcaceae bacterium]|nr:GTP-binding protein [Oscillospiraceae bacterium]